MRFQEVFDSLSEALIGRDREIRIALVALVSRQHFLMISEPGTAKSMLVGYLAQATGAKYMGQLMHKELSADELLGNVMLSEFKSDRVVRNTSGMAPEAQMLFLDEIWKCSPALRTSTLQLLNERTFRNGHAGVMECPLWTCFAASNEWPIGPGFEQDGALFDRFLLRTKMTPISTIEEDELVWGDLPVVDSQLVTMDEIAAAHEESLQLPIDDSTVEAHRLIRNELRKAGINPGNRRMRQSADVARAAAVLDESDVVLPKHLEPLQYVLWQSPDDERPASEIVMRHADPIGFKVTELQLAAEEALSGLDDRTSDQEFTACLKKARDILTELKTLSNAGNERARVASRSIAELTKKAREQWASRDMV